MTKTHKELIEDKVEEFWGKFAWCDLQNSEDNKRMNDWLNTTLLTLRREWLEELKTTVEGFDAFTCCSDKCMGKVSDEAKKPRWGTNYLAREAVLSALQTLIDADRKEL